MLPSNVGLAAEPVSYRLMKQVTISLDDGVALWARGFAARRNQRLSQLLAELLRRSMRDSLEYDTAMQRYLSKLPAMLNDRGASYPFRADLYRKERFEIGGHDS